MIIGRALLRAIQTEAAAWHLRRTPVSELLQEVAARNSELNQFRVQTTSLGDADR